MDSPRTSFGGRRTRHCHEHLAPPCGTIDAGSRFETAPVAILVEPPPDPQFDEKVKDICEVYLSAIERAEQGERTIAIDEMTGIQALERKSPDQPMRPGKRERREFEYIRHGTQTLIASFDVTQGRVVEASVGETRTEADYLSHVQQLIATDPHVVKWHLVMDCLNIHQSESLVRFVAQTERLNIDLGVKGKSGILKSMLAPSGFFA